MARRPRIALPALFGLLLALPLTAFAESEAAVKAAFIYNFTKYTEWPPAGGNTLQLCLLGRADPLLSAVAALQGKQSQDRRIVVRSVELGTDALNGCRVIVVGASEEGHLADILRDAQKQPALTVSEIDRFIDAGGMIGLVVNDARVQFEINAGAAERAKLKFSAQMMKLAQRVMR
jgi:hypothetical protein